MVGHRVQEQTISSLCCAVLEASRTARTPGYRSASVKCTKAPPGLVRVICGTGRLANAMHERSLHAAALTIRQHPAASASLHKSRGPRPRSLMSFCRAWHITSQERAWTGCYCRYHFLVHDRAGCSGWMPCSSAGCRHGLLAGPPPLVPPSHPPQPGGINCGNWQEEKSGRAPEAAPRRLSR